MLLFSFLVSCLVYRETQGRVLNRRSPRFPLPDIHHQPHNLDRHSGHQLDEQTHHQNQHHPHQNPNHETNEQTQVHHRQAKEMVKNQQTSHLSSRSKNQLDKEINHQNSMPSRRHPHSQGTKPDNQFSDQFVPMVDQNRILEQIDLGTSTAIISLY